MTRLTRGVLISMLLDTSSTSGSAAIASSRTGRPGVQLLGVQALHGHVVGAVAGEAADLKGRRQRQRRPEAREP